MSQQAPGKSFRKGIMMELFRMFPDNQWRESSKMGASVPNAATRTPRKQGILPCHTTATAGRTSRSRREPSWNDPTYPTSIGQSGRTCATSRECRMKIHRDLGITQKSAWFMVHRLRESWKTLAGVDKMEGPVVTRYTLAGWRRTSIVIQGQGHEQDNGLRPRRQGWNTS